ncbi:ubiquitin carboxyl-terminal [Babesia ovata]|uniref:Ubiquitin carboxyl-terminal n=1 Tax=Babesia ovata TaxID=189622 RepID=A0A2H6KCB6_9APIC|nr:ubiquitin carboxyl-terminal [Babesia ovata]GBE60627.1 ubiquitin carboxyl-terminal [Babesia ovata]
MRNNFFLEKNPTIVSFPMKNLDLSAYVDDRAPDKRHMNARYDLVCNVCHQGSPAAGRYKIHVLHGPSGDWFELEDLLVTSVLPQFVAQSEDDEDQIMFDLYDGLDTFAQKSHELGNPSDKPITTKIAQDTYPKELEHGVASKCQFKELGAEDLGSGVAGPATTLEDEDDGLIFIVEDDERETDTVIERNVKGSKPSGRAKLGGWATKYTKKGAPSSDSQAMASVQPVKECFCLVTGIPWWMDVHEFNHSLESIGGIVAFSKILSDPTSGVSLGSAVVEFVDCGSCSTFRNSKSRFTTAEVSDDIFELIKDSSLYREGVFNTGVLKRILAHLGITVRKHATGLQSDPCYEMDFEVQQLDMIQDGEFQAASNFFPWLNLKMLKLMGCSKRREQKNSESTYHIANHLEAYQHKNNVVQNSFNKIMPKIVMNNYMQEATKDMGETGMFPFPFVLNPLGQQTKGAVSMRMKQGNLVHDDQEPNSSNTKRPKLEPSRKEKGDERRGDSSTSPSRRRQSPCRNTNRNSSHHRRETCKRDRR